MPLCNVFAAAAWVANYDAANPALLTTAAQLWMGFALLLFVAVFPIAVNKAILGHNQDVHSRSMHWMLVAAPAVLGLGWQLAVAPGVISPVFTSLYFGSLVLLAVLLYGIYPMR